MTNDYTRCDFGEGNNIVDENDEMDALGSFLNWDEVDESSGVNNTSNDLTSSNQTAVNFSGTPNQNALNLVCDNNFLAQLKAEIATHNSNQANRPPRGNMQMELSNTQQPLTSPEMQQQQQQPQPIHHPHVQQQPQQDNQHLSQQLRFAQNYVPNYVSQNVASGNIQQQIFAPPLGQPAQNNPIYATSTFGLLTQTNTQQLNEMNSNVYNQAQQQINPDFLQALQHNLSTRMPPNMNTQDLVQILQQNLSTQLPSNVNPQELIQVLQQHLSTQRPAQVAQHTMQSQSQQQQQQTRTIAGSTITTVNDSTSVKTPSTQKPIQSTPVIVQPSSCSSKTSDSYVQKMQTLTAINKKGQQKQNRKKNASSTNPSSRIVSCSDTDYDVRSASSSQAPKRTGILAVSSMGESEMNPEEKAKANRDRNREHARNTRLRKKAYLEKLKTTVDELCKERDDLVSERSGKANRLVEIQNKRTKVLLRFFSLRSCNESRRHVWGSILDESCFQCVMPVTPYRSFPASEVQISRSQRTIFGIDGMMSDTTSLHVLLNSLVNRSLYPKGKIKFRYTLLSDDAVVSGNQMMTRWSMSTINAVENGACSEVCKRGFLGCKFSSAHTIVGLEIMFDVMAFMLQLKQSSGSESFRVIPNTIQTSQRPYSKPMIVTIAEPPYNIIQVNHLWENMTGYSAKDVIGKSTPKILQGKETDRSTIQEIMKALSFKQPCQVTVLNYTKNGEKFLNFLSLYPLSTDSKITHYLGLSDHYKDLKDEGKKKSAKRKQGETEQKRESSVSATSATVSSITSKSSNSMSSKGSNSQQKKSQEGTVHMK